LRCRRARAYACPHAVRPARVSQDENRQHETDKTKPIRASDERQKGGEDEVIAPGRH
jgi:hypothetical protein